MATIPLDQILPFTDGLVLKQTMLREVCVLGIAIVALTATFIAMTRRGGALVRRAMPGLMVVVFVGAAAMTAFWPTKLALWTHEGHLLEWLSSAVLLGALVVAVATVVCPRRPGELGAFISAGLFVALLRELQFGEPFVGEKVINSRYFFRPAAWFDPSKFADLSEEVNVPVESLRLIHVTCAAVLFIVLGAVVVYLVVRRKQFTEQLRWFLKMPGRLFVIGFGLYAGTQVLGTTVEEPIAAAWPNWAESVSFSNSFIDEPIELIAAMFMSMAVLALWHGEGAAPPAALGEQAGASLREN